LGTSLHRNTHLDDLKQFTVGPSITSAASHAARLAPCQPIRIAAAHTTILTEGAARNGEQPANQCSQLRIPQNHIFGHTGTVWANTPIQIWISSQRVFLHVPCRFLTGLSELAPKQVTLIRDPELHEGRQTYAMISGLSRATYPANSNYLYSHPCFLAN